MSAMPAYASSDPLAFLTRWPASTAAAQRVTEWDGVEALAYFDTAGQAARAAADDPTIFAALAARADDPAATLAAMAAVAFHLRPVVSRWRSAGLHGAELEDAAGDLIAATLTALRSGHPTDAGAVAARAWQQASGRRRTERERSTHQLPLFDPDRRAAPDGDSLRSTLAHLVESVTAGTLTLTLATALWATVCGWPAIDAAARLGISPATWRTRTHRAVRALRNTESETATQEGGRA